MTISRYDVLVSNLRGHGHGTHLNTFYTCSLFEQFGNNKKSSVEKAKAKLNNAALISAAMD